MTLSTTPQSFCMSLKTTLRRPRREQDKKKTELRSIRKKSTNSNVTVIPIEKQIAELLFDNCIDCKKMSAIPHGVFAACKVRKNEERYSIISEMNAKGGGNENKGNYHSYNNNKPINQSTELTPLKYNSKLMNSIWGLYNRYSVHNFKKNTDSKDGGLVAGWRASLAPLAPQNPAMTASDKPRVLMP